MEEKRTICLLNDSFPPIIDGVANAVVNYAGIIEKEYGHAVVATPADSMADDSRFPFPVIRYPSIDARKSTGYMAGIPFSPQLAERLEEEHAQILHAHCPIISTFLARSLREQIHAPVVLTYHTKFDIDIANVIHNPLLQDGSIHALAQNISACDEVWVVSRGAGENLRSIGYEGDYIVMPNGVDLKKGRIPDEIVAQVTAGYDLPNDVPTYLFVGRLMWYKGLRIILDGLKTLKEEGYPFRMVFAGAGGDGAEIREYAEQLGLTDRCFFIGAVTEREDIRAWYTRADLFLFPSTFDTNGLVVREAAAAELPAVLIRGSCAAEDTEDGRNAFWIEENAESMAQCLKTIGQDRALLRQVGHNASGELYMSWEDAVKRADERYGIVLENYRSGLYEEHHGFTDGVFDTLGEIMETFGQAELLHKELEEKHQRDQEILRQRRDEMLAELRSHHEYRKEQFEEKRREVWQFLDRYL